MSAHPWLHLIADGQRHHRVRLGHRPLLIGRAPSCDLSFSFDEVSGHHALIWQEEGHVWLRDLGSRNGTTVNGQSVRQPVELSHMDLVQVGTRGRIQLDWQGGNGPRPGPSAAFLVEDVKSGVRFPWRGAQFYLGPEDDADLVVDVDEGVTLASDEEGRLWVEQGDERRSFGAGDEVTVLGRTLRVSRSYQVSSATVGTQSPYAHRLYVDMSNPTGPRARLTSAGGGRAFDISSANQATLLYLLGRERQRDVGGEEPAEGRGWCSDEDLAVGIWGRTGRERASGRINTVVSRLRKALTKGGFEPWFLEKRRGYTRLHVGQIELR